MNKNKVKSNYRDACNAYLKLFCDKHGYSYDPDAWVAQAPGTIALVGDLYIDMQTLCEDIDRDAPEPEFIRWYDYSVRAQTLGITVPNFHSWLSRCPVRTEDELAALEESQRRIEKLKSDFERQIRQYNKGEKNLTPDKIR